MPYQRWPRSCFAANAERPISTAEHKFTTNICQNASKVKTTDRQNATLLVIRRRARDRTIANRVALTARLRTTGKKVLGATILPQVAWVSTKYDRSQLPPKSMTRVPTFKTTPPRADTRKKMLRFETTIGQYIKERLEMVGKSTGTGIVRDSYGRKWANSPNACAHFA
jgi:hypothetical protein